MGFFVPLSGCDSGQDVPVQLTRDQTELQVSADEVCKELKVTWPQPGSPSLLLAMVTPKWPSLVHSEGPKTKLLP